MNNHLSLAIPSPATRQVGVSMLGSPLELARSTSDAQTPEESLKHRLQVYKVHLEHDIEFINSEINALASQTSNAFVDLRSGLKIRYNNLQTRLARVNALLEVL